MRPTVMMFVLGYEWILTMTWLTMYTVAIVHKLLPVTSELVC